MKGGSLLQTADNLSSMRAQINFYKALRQLLQFDEFYRLQAPDAYTAVPN
ncbi:hypothetical protein P7H59_00870 [Enterococcus viikkiensis]|uniref:Uncharacterized protein n=1 Tax=Enterococcus viikkiensis TaxID=930854 RepID=A0ABU3FM67_9ENTE|nr:hypothetical protein [Enterococcus viikkiensis]